VIRHKTPHDLYLAGRSLLEKEQFQDAIIAFEMALEECPEEPLYMSYLGLALAKARRNGKRAIELCEKAARRHFYQADLLHNLGRVYLMSGQRGKAHVTFREGMGLGDDADRNFEGLEEMGVRIKPVFSFLDRKHPLNKYAGMTLKRLGMR
jgi:tetratricopeptide (TPR) repeat protein